jgi:hypothetical protein
MRMLNGRTPCNEETQEELVGWLTTVQVDRGFPESVRFPVPRYRAL